MSEVPANVERFVNRILREFSRPYPQTITNDIFCKIEDTPQLRRDYDAFCRERGQGVVNQTIGKFVKALTGLKVLGRANARGTTLISTYTRLG